jgi:SpoVK/Ycf46/Vps4 family AAA+-type ATPase
MNTTNNKLRSNQNKFRSSTDVNNYNKFLLELDNKQIKLIKETKEVKEIQKIDDYLKNINHVYEKYKSSINQPINQVESADPNMYISVDPNKLAFLYEKRKQIQDNLDQDKKKQEEEEEEERENRIKVNIQCEINNIGDLLKMIDEYPDDKNIEYNINMHSLHKIKEPLLELNAMIGMQNLKENIVDQLLFYIQNLHIPSANDKKENKKKVPISNDFMHTVIYGPPGTGKTEIAKIIGSIFAKLGILSKGTFKKVTRSDLVAGYLGQTALKTRDVIKESLGGVLFIDEAYALGNQEKRDSFSKECIDTLCEALSDHKDNLMVIIAGYETDLNECFFKYNQGLNSRFTWRLKIDNYNAMELHNIFIKKINDSGWLIDNSVVNVKWFEKNKGLFKFYGRDIEALFAKTKIAHSRRVFCLDESTKKRLTIADIDKGLDIYLKNGAKNEDESAKRFISNMYT